MRECRKYIVESQGGEVVLSQSGMLSDLNTISCPVVSTSCLLYSFFIHKWGDPTCTPCRNASCQHSLLVHHVNSGTWILLTPVELIIVNNV